jgi:hypothetical protein
MYLRVSWKNDVRHTLEISNTATAKAAFNKNKAIFTSKLETSEIRSEIP